MDWPTIYPYATDQGIIDLVPLRDFKLIQDRLALLEWRSLEHSQPTAEDGDSCEDVEWSNGADIWQGNFRDSDRATHWRPICLPNHQRHDGERKAMNTSDTNFEPLPALADSGCPECEARSSAQWVKEYGKENLGVNRATGHCRTCCHRFHAEDSYFPEEGDYCAAVSVDEIQFCPAWREHCQNNPDHPTN